MHAVDLVPPTDYDVIVVGGGIAGVCTAIVLAQLGLRVCLFAYLGLGAGASGYNDNIIHSGARVRAGPPSLFHTKIVMPALVIYVNLNPSTPEKREEPLKFLWCTRGATGHFAA